MRDINDEIFIEIWQNVFFKVGTNIDPYYESINELRIKEVTIKVHSPVDISVYSQVRDLIKEQMRNEK